MDINRLIPLNIERFFFFGLSCLLKFCTTIQPAVRRRSDSVTLIIEAGEKGWQSIEYEELYESAQEYLGKDSVSALKVSEVGSYIDQVKKIINTAVNPTHFFFDPRTLEGVCRNEVLVIFNTLRLSFLLAVKGITPIVYLTDAAVKSQRLRGISVSARRGFIAALIDPSDDLQLFADEAVFGPIPMSVSKKKVHRLARDMPNFFSNETKRCARFVGAMYSPRTEFLYELARQLGPDFEIIEKRSSNERTSNNAYWEALGGTQIQVTTACQSRAVSGLMKSKNQMVYRCSEVLAVGRLLIAPRIPGMNNYFQPGVHFVEFNDSNDAVEKIRYYLRFQNEAYRIAMAGHQRIQEISADGGIWKILDEQMGVLGRMYKSR